MTINTILVLFETNPNNTIHFQPWQQQPHQQQLLLLVVVLEVVQEPTQPQHPQHPRRACLTFEVAHEARSQRRWPQSWLPRPLQMAALTTLLLHWEHGR